jgi:hypothetical protein
LLKKKKISYHQKYGKYYQKYKVLMNMEFTREFLVRANTKEEAAERLEEMIRAKQKYNLRKGLVLGDVDAIHIEEIEDAKR